MIEFNHTNKTSLRLSKSVIVLSALALGLSACESDKQAKIAEAQACLDKATQGGGAVCAAKVAGDVSEKASLVRCAALYIDNGFVGSRIAEAFQGLTKKSDDNSTTNPMITTMAFMTFKTMDIANKAMSECTASRVLSMERLATMSQMPTFLASQAANVFPGGIPTDRPLSEAEMQAVIDDFAATADTTDKTTLGNMVIQAESAYCSAGSSFKGTKTCTDLEAAVAGGDAAAIGQQLLCQLKPGTAGC